MTRPPTKRPAFAPSHADTLRANKKAMQHYAALSGRDTPGEQLSLQTVRDKVTRGPRKPRTEAQGKSEGEVQKEILEFLGEHVSTHLVLRVNSGAVQSSDYYVQFNRVYLPWKYRVSFPQTQPKMAMPDLLAILVDGKLCAIEVKKQRWVQTLGDSDTAIRERQQANFLAHIRQCGGLGIFACSADDVRIALIAAGYAG